MILWQDWWKSIKFESVFMLILTLFILFLKLEFSPRNLFKVKIGSSRIKTDLPPCWRAGAMVGGHLNVMNLQTRKGSFLTKGRITSPIQPCYSLSSSFLPIFLKGDNR